MNINKISMWTDGACSGNPGNGGWGVLIKNYDKIIKLSGSENDTTNNRMEMTAVIIGLENIKENSNLTIYTDSKYVKDGITKWIFNWKKNNWKNSQKKDIKNKDLWLILDKKTLKYNIEWKWVKGHSDNEENNIADYLATSAIKKN